MRSATFHPQPLIRDSHPAEISHGEFRHSAICRRRRRGPRRKRRRPARRARKDGAARNADRGISSGAQILVARLAVRQPRAHAAAHQGPLHLRRRRPRQDHADGFVLRNEPGRAQAPRPFSRIHARRARTHSRRAAGHEARRARRRRSDPARRRRAGRPGVAALLRRVSRHRHRRRHDPRAAVHAIVRARHRDGGNLERARRTSSTRTA